MESKTINDVLYIERITYQDYKGGTGNQAICQLYQGPLCVAKGSSIHGPKQAIKNAYRQLARIQARNS